MKSDVKSCIDRIEKGMIAVLVENSTVLREIHKQLKCVKHNNLIVYDPDSENDDYKTSRKLSKFSSLYTSCRNHQNIFYFS